MNPIPLIRFESVSKSFPGVNALTDISFAIYSGETHVLMGENGAGKSTLMKILSGAYQPNKGQILLDGKPLVVRSPIHAAELGIAMIYQELTILDNLDVGRNIMLGQEPASGVFMRWDELYRQAQAIIDELQLDLDARTPTDSLNIAQKQMVEIARAARRRLRVIVMDEPTSSLGKQEEEVLFALIERLKQRGIAIIYISHRMDEVFRLADRITVLRDGTHVVTDLVAHFTRDRLIELMVGRKITLLNRQTASYGEVLLETRRLSRAMSVNEINLTVRSGEIVGVAGLIGAGQTALAQLLFGMEQADTGAIFINNQPVRLRSPQEAIAQGIAYVPEDRKGLGLVLVQSVQTNTILANLASVSRLGVISNSRVKTLVQQWVQRLNIRTSSHAQIIENLSGGNQQKVVLAKWLCREPRILILNEPTRGIDVGAKAEVHILIREIARQGVAILMISSELPEVIAVSDRIVVMCNGSIAGELSAEGATESAILALAFSEGLPV